MMEVQWLGRWKEKGRDDNNIKTEHRDSMIKL